VSYDWWRQQLGRELPLGMFGENLTIEGLVDDDVCVGDVFTVGSARLMAVQPRQPCGKLAARFEDEGIVAAFLASGRFGVYFRVPGWAERFRRWLEA
jgi:MOSC domain-containing protein YiiM